MMFFESTFGFPESNCTSAQKVLLDGAILLFAPPTPTRGHWQECTFQVGTNKISAGTFSMPLVEQLWSWVQAEVAQLLEHQTGETTRDTPITVRNMVGEAWSMHSQPFQDNLGNAASEDFPPESHRVFQEASQFNPLEFPSPNVVPEQEGIQGCIHDGTKVQPMRWPVLVGLWRSACEWDFFTDWLTPQCEIRWETRSKSSLNAHDFSKLLSRWRKIIPFNSLKQVLSKTSSIAWGKEIECKQSVCHGNHRQEKMMIRATPQLLFKWRHQNGELKAELHWKRCAFGPDCTVPASSLSFGCHLKLRLFLSFVSFLNPTMFWWIDKTQPFLNSNKRFGALLHTTFIFFRIFKLFWQHQTSVGAFVLICWRTVAT